MSCEYCDKTITDGFPISWDSEKPTIKMYQITNYKKWFKPHSDKTIWEYPINYCPICGRKLGGE